MIRSKICEHKYPHFLGSEVMKGDNDGVNESKRWGSGTLSQWRGFWGRPFKLKAIREMVTNFRPLPSDTILAVFLKTGTTWLKSIVFLITHRHLPTTRSIIRTHNPHLLVPQLEYQIYGPNPQDITSFPGASMADTRLMATHAAYEFLKNYASNCRIVYIVRNPKDTIVSYWHFLLKLEAESLKLEDVVDMFCDGQIPFGPYYDHVLGYWKKSLEMPEKVFVITYEELQEDPITHVKRLAMFLGCPFDGEDDHEAEEIVKTCSFENLSQQQGNESNSDVLTWWKSSSNAFFRKGKVGDYVNYLNPEMVEKIDSITKQKFHGAGFNYGV